MGPTRHASATARSPRGYDQCGTLGSGNHFLEVQVVDRVHDAVAAEVMGLAEGQLTVLIHSGSRGLGYQVCDDYLATFKNAPKAVRVRATGLAARLSRRCGARRSSLPGRHEGGGQLRLVQPATPHTPGARGLRPRLRQTLGRAGDGPGVRRRPQHRQVRGALRRRRAIQAGLRASQGRDTCVSAGTSRDSADLCRRLVSR